MIQTQEKHIKFNSKKLKFKLPKVTFMGPVLAPNVWNQMYNATMTRIDPLSTSVMRGAALLSESQPIAFASRALTNRERNNPQIKKVRSAIMLACGRFHQYLLGHVFVTIPQQKAYV
ncbi:K02A2.6-like [Cordylochernes scorpioides]|uniref:K02A2.6-like n=1 Tax=Cordylochernes scorpioides TaxID=51811 RepID=A0ABY6KKX0_9ARAC|nr:K02A2.6-like [Cordylochernes scorpioides]